MKILWLFVILHTTLAQPGFGKSYLRNSRLCHQWSCVNTKLGLLDSLPTSEEFGNVLRRLLPSGDWQGVVDNVTNTCYHDRPRRYSNTCPGQAIMHCAFDQLIANCPETSFRKEDACAPINSLAGYKYMFSQSRYEDLERNIATERRPAWFLRNYFNTKCCNLPDIFNSTVLSECGFTSMILYYTHNAQYRSQAVLPSQRRFNLPTNKGNTVQAVSLKDYQATNNQATIDPLECCDMSSFIQPQWREECNFALKWDGQRRLAIQQELPSSVATTTTSTAAPFSTSTSRPFVRRDITIVPQSCEKVTCVFNKLNVISPSGAVDKEAFAKILDNLTSAHPAWNSAKARVLTTCLRKPLTEYEAECEINKLLACTYDVLSENCPDAPRNDLCKHTKMDMICQISSSKYRPKNRRETCFLPELVASSVLIDCNLNSLRKIEQVQSAGIVSHPKKYRLFTSQYKCQDLTPATSCVLSKMGVLNQYGFTNYFKMKDHIRHLGSDDEWAPLVNVTLGAFSNGPLYREHCNSPKKFLNLMDSMLLTCPVSKRKHTSQCNNLFNQITNTPVYDRKVNSGQADQIIQYFHQAFFPPSQNYTHKFMRPKHTRKFIKKPIYSYGLLLSDKNEPKVTTINVKPKVQQPLVLLPVYMRIPASNSAQLHRPFQENGILRSPFALHNQIAQAHTVSTSSPLSTTSIISTKNDDSLIIKPN